MVSSVRGLPSSSGVVVGDSQCSGWWLVDDAAEGPGRILAGPFPDRTEAAWAAGAYERATGGIRPVHGRRRPDGGLDRRPATEEWAWLAHLGQQLDRLPPGWDEGLAEDDVVVTLVVEVAAVLLEAGLPLHDAHGPARESGGVCLTPAPGLDGLVVSWRRHDRMSVEQVHGAAADDVVAQTMTRALVDVLAVHGFVVEPFGTRGMLVRPPA
jgi:hypothetical protein